MKMNKILMKMAAAAAALVAAFTLEAQDKQISPDGTYMFVKRDTCDLYLDVYNPAEGSRTSIAGKEKPTVIFMFGGGFIRG